MFYPEKSKLPHSGLAGTGSLRKGHISDQVYMSPYCILNPFRAYVDIPLCGGSARMLQECLYQGDVMSVLIVDIGRIVFPKAVRADIFISEIVRDFLQVFLDPPLLYGEDLILGSDPVLKAVVLDIHVHFCRDRESPLFPGLLLMDVEPVSVAVLYYVLKTEFQDVLDPQSQICLKHKCRCYPGILPESCTAFMHCLYDLFVLLFCECHGHFVRHFISFFIRTIAM